jgi:hypothetical protein
MIEDTGKRPAVANDEHDRSRMRVGRRQVQSMDGAFGLQRQDLGYPTRERVRINRCSIDRHCLLEFYLEGIVKLAMVTILAGKMEALRIGKDVPEVVVGPDTPAEWIQLP